MSANGFPVSNFHNFGFAPKLKFEFIFFLISLNVSSIWKQRLLLGHVLSSRDNFTSLTRNGLPRSNFHNFGFAPKLKFELILFLISHNVSSIWNQSLSFGHFLSSRDNSTSLYRIGFPRANFHNFGFAPQTQIQIYIFFRIALCICKSKPKSFFRPRVQFKR